MLLFIFMIIVLCTILGARRLRAPADIPSKDKWPPITEDEFIRRCSPGVDRELALKVRRVIAEQLGVEYDRVYPEQRLVEDLGCD